MNGTQSQTGINWAAIINSWSDLGLDIVSSHTVQPPKTVLGQTVGADLSSQSVNTGLLVLAFGVLAVIVLSGALKK